MGAFRRTRFRGLARTGLAGYFVTAAYNLVRIARLMRIGARAKPNTAGATLGRAIHWPYTPSS